MKEQWKPIKDYENYIISNFGEVKSLGNNKSRKEKLLKPGKDGKGYLFVRLCKNGTGKYFRIHRLVYSAFVEEIPEDMQVNHLDENKENNRVDNLNLMTPKQNVNWGTRNARSAAAQINHPQMSKPIEAIDKVTGRVVYVFPSTREAGRQGFNHVAVAACCRNCYSTHKGNIYKGFIWRYKENAQA